MFLPVQYDIGRFFLILSVNNLSIESTFFDGKEPAVYVAKVLN